MLKVSGFDAELRKPKNLLNRQNSGFVFKVRVFGVKINEITF